MSENPLGPYLAASLLGGEVFKRARGISRGRLVDDLACSLWTGQTGRWDELGDGPELRGRDLPPLYIIGAGAVGQGLLNLIGAAKFASEYVVTIDDDRHDRTNFNRCFLAGIDDDRHHKVEAVKRFRGFARLAGFEFPGTLADYVSKRRKIGLCDDIAAAEREGKYGIVASCVDKGSSRQDVQGLGPSLIVGGSTLGLAAKANVYNGAAGTPCLGCYNPPEADGARLRRIEQEMRALGRIERRSALEGRVKDIEAVLAYVDSGMRCGMAGEADFRAFATAQTREFSAGFVSMAAAVLMASRLFSQVLFPAGPHASRRKMTSLAFLAGSLEDGALAIDPSCRRCGAIEAEPSAQRSG
jgi:molybdopterin/thiamine biosynthesis adenylyltransferase